MEGESALARATVFNEAAMGLQSCNYKAATYFFGKRSCRRCARSRGMFTPTIKRTLLEYLNLKQTPSLAC